MWNRIQWILIATLGLPFFVAWDISNATGSHAFAEASFGAALMVMVINFLLWANLNALHTIRQEALAPKAQRIRDYYAVEVFSVKAAGRELIQGNKDGGYYVSRVPSGKLERTVVSDPDDLELGIAWSQTWTEKGGSEWASREILVFEDYAVATACAQEIAERRLHLEFARKVSLRVVAGENRKRAHRQVGSHETWSRRWPTKFADVELASG
jgi:hypothetical protein